jgi:hypothetical protein
VTNQIAQFHTKYYLHPILLLCKSYMSPDLLVCNFLAPGKIPYSGYFLGGGGQNFRVPCTLHLFVEKNSWSCCMHTGMRVHFCQFRGLIILLFAFQPRKPRKFCPPKNTRYTVYCTPGSHILCCRLELCFCCHSYVSYS